MLRQSSEVEAISAQESLVTISERVILKRVLALPSEQRRQSDLLSVYRVLQKVEFVAKLDLKVQERLATIVHYEHFEPFSTVFHEGEIGRDFYIIISGTLAVKKWSGATYSFSEKPPNLGSIDEGTLTTLVTLTAGQSFGELALVEENGKRAATIVTTSEVECLTISGEDYRHHLSRIHHEELMEKVDVLQHQPTFAGWSQKDLEHLASIMLTRKVPYNTVIIEQENETDALYFIKSGEVRVVRRMSPSKRFLRQIKEDPILSARVSPNPSLLDKYKSLPKQIIRNTRSLPPTPRSDWSSARSLSHRDTSQDIFVELMTLGPYSTFGEVAALKGSCRAASVISNSFTELLVLTRHDLLNKVNSSTRRKLEEHGESYRNDKELLEDLMESMKWEKYKSDLVQSILKERQKEHYLVSYTDQHQTHSFHIQPWRP